MNTLSAHSRRRENLSPTHEDLGIRPAYFCLPEYKALNIEPGLNEGGCKMAITRYSSPFSEIRNLHDQLGRLFEP
ncbi:MAG: hypothetical protein R3338_07305, partial [Thermoanaerobaculia bacterium]|nr:hypothetical protein [Thermoanaerobaculia bacterium]